MLRRIIILLVLIAPLAAAQSADSDLLEKVRAIPAIDNHSHPPRLVAPGEMDDEYDALPCEPLEPTKPTLTGRPENPQFIAAWKALYEYKYDDAAPEHVRELLATKNAKRTEEGDNYANWVLGRLGIETELANRVALGRGLAPPHFRWVPFEDALLFPLANERLAAATPDRNIFFAREDGLRKRYLEALHLVQLPPTLKEYVSQVVVPTIADHKKQGAVAIKFEAAYLRSLDFEPAAEPEAASIYARFVRGGVPGDAEYKKLQDFLFRRMATEAGTLGLPVHIHTGVGCGNYFELAGANPLLLESVFDDPALRRTRFVMLHGGAGPFTQAIAPLLMKPNVYADFSEQTWLVPTRELSRVIRYWLEWYPEKILFGTDLSPGTPEIGWEEIGWQTTNSAREALAIALTGMMRDREITRARAEEIAVMVLRGNALRLYGWSEQK
ncbi:MAG: amidohydrolase family protein [Candidatus Acidiferrales bacterium]